jgi:putative heme iron utilization protein
VPFCLDQQGRVILLISDLAQHTKNFKVDSRCSLLVFAESDDIQAAARLTLIGDAQPISDEVAAIAARYYRYFPQSQDFHQIHDFSFWRITPVKYRYIGGFGRIHWAEPQLVANPFTAELEADMVQHMNQDHADTFALYCQQAQIAMPDHATLQMVGMIAVQVFICVLAKKVVILLFLSLVSQPQQVRTAFSGYVKINTNRSINMSFLLVVGFLIADISGQYLVWQNGWRLDVVVMVCDGLFFGATNYERRNQRACMPQFKQAQQGQTH